MLQVILLVFAVACLIGLISTRKMKGVRARVVRAAALAAVLGCTGVGFSLVPAPLTADEGIQYANFVGTDMSATEELSVVPLEAYPDGKYILVEEASEGQYIRFKVAEDGIERRLPSEEVIFTSSESFEYETPVIRYGRCYLDPDDRAVTFMGRRWEFIHIVMAPEYFGIWAG